MTEQAKPTPGPWFVRGKTANLQIAIVGPSGELSDSIAYAWGQNGEAEANARLIAAAPELLEALEGAIGALEQDVDAGENEDDAEWVGIATQRLEAARAAIAKARGGSDA